jgi:PmbA protein
MTTNHNHNHNHITTSTHAMTDQDAQLSLSHAQLQTLAERVLAMAKAQGATDAECDIATAVGYDINVRHAQVDTLNFNEDKGINVSVYLGQARGHASSADLSDQGLAAVVEAAMNIAKFTKPDPYAGLAVESKLGYPNVDLNLYHPYQGSMDDAIALACEAESVALGVSQRITNTEGAGFSTEQARFVYANSLGFSGGWSHSMHSLSASVIASDAQGDMERDYWYTSARDAADLLSAQSVGQQAGERTLRRLGARPIKTGVYPVLFDATIAASLFKHAIAALSGGALYRGNSFLLDSLGQPIFSSHVNLIEKPLMIKGMASRLFDSEGVAPIERSLVSQGVIDTYFLGSYSARKLGLKTTGHASGTGNIEVSSTGQDWAGMLQALGTGVWVTELIGQGVNGLTGDYSRGAAGFWVENGEIKHPVNELTIAANLRDMYRHILAIGQDTLPNSAWQIGSVLIDRMTVASQSEA